MADEQRGLQRDRQVLDHPPGQELGILAGEGGLRLFTRAGNQLPLSFMSLLSFLVPLVAIGLGFDLVNSEHNQRTLSRILAQPIYRDALLFGKFLGGLATITIGLVALWLLVIGLGLVMLGLPPSLEEMARAFIMLGVTIIYAGVWLALAMLFSICDSGTFL